MKLEVSLEELHSAPEAVAYFTASWCGPCKALRPVMVAVAEKIETPVYLIDADAHADIVSHYGISSVPTRLVLRYGAEVGRVESRRALPIIQEIQTILGE